MRVLGIDFGRSRTGLALSDPLEVSCRPLGIVVERDQERLVGQVVSAAREQEVGRIVVGLPRPLSGRMNSQMASVLVFTEQLRAAAEVPVLTWDERFTTTLAAQGRPRSAPRDAVAACYMLQNYLDSLSSTSRDA